METYSWWQLQGALNMKQKEAVIRKLGIDPEDMQAVVDNHDRVEEAIKAAQIAKLNKKRTR